MDKTSQCRVENQQTQPTYDAGSGNGTRAILVGGECSNHCAIPALLSDRFWPLINVYALCKEDLCNVPSTPVSSFHQTTADFYFLLKRVNLLLTTELCILIISSQMHSIAFCAVTQILFEAVY